MKTYEPATEAETIANTVAIPKWHKHLAGASIAYLLDADQMQGKGKDILAKIRKANPVEHHLTGHDLVMLISEPSWVKATPGQRLALIDHELCHVILDDNNNLMLTGHDIEEFRAVVQRHGDWQSDITLFAEALQGDLFEQRLERLRPKKGSGVDSVTLSAGGESVTLKAE